METGTVPVVMIFLVLAAQNKPFRDPFIMLIRLPMSILGARCSLQP